MGTWILPIRAGLDEHWEIARENQLWDLPNRQQFTVGDEVYFWQASDKGIVGRARVIAPINIAPDSRPWLKIDDRKYRYRVKLESFEDHIGQKITWSEAAGALGNPKFPAGQVHGSSEAAAALAMTALFERGRDSAAHGTPLPTFDATYVSDSVDYGVDLRDHELRAITIRRGQPQFRRLLLHHYRHKCAVTGTTEDRVLEAAHIRPYKGEHTNAPSNGILLRADIHTLFDSFLLTIIKEADKYVVRVSPLVEDETYRALDGTELTVPDDPAARPAEEHLMVHNADCQRLISSVTNP